LFETEICENGETIPFISWFCSWCVLTKVCDLIRDKVIVCETLVRDSLFGIESVVWCVSVLLIHVCGVCKGCWEFYELCRRKVVAARNICGFHH